MTPYPNTVTTTRVSPFRKFFQKTNINYPNGYVSFRSKGNGSA
jgi:hypothetical protein